MNTNNDIIMINNTDSEYIDKVILILNGNKKRIVPEELLLKQAEKIIYEYENKNVKKRSYSLLKISGFILGCIAISIITCFVGMHLFS
ncbi:MAG: hypothetical protein IKZ35_02415 [Clostridia bacterium]|nr:hypothetical protein [Oscillospiraceae bacterium]MBR4892816.1 hypothetical protein [Clostridia bacterium]